MPTSQDYFRVKVNGVFLVGNDTFYPNVEYLVTNETYQGKTADGRDFKDMCASAVQETQTFGA